MERPLPPGTLQMYAIGAVNSDVPREQTAERTARLNKSSFLEATFFDPNHASNLLNASSPDGSSLSLYDQSGKYGDFGLMVIAKGPRSFDEEDAITEVIYDYPSETQDAYWQFVLGSMTALRDNSPVEGMRVIASENCIREYSGNHRTSRTIALPHIHVTGIVESNIQPETVFVPSLHEPLSREQRLTQKFGKHVADKVQRRLPDEIQEQIQLSSRDVPPYGYSFVVGGSIEEMAKNPALFARIMQTHHQAYASVARPLEKLLRKKLPKNEGTTLIPSPSYRLYLEDSNNRMHVTISPEFLSHAGSMEAAGVLLDRRPTYPKRYNEEVGDKLQRLAVSKVQGLISDKSELKLAA
jgi:hypothetical protein